MWLCLKSKSVHKRSDHCLAISTLTTGYMILNVLRVLCWKTSLNDYFWSKIALYLVIWSWKIRRRVRSFTRCALAEVIFLVFPIVVLSRISCIFFVSLSCQKSISHSFNLVTSSCNTGFRTVSKQRHPRMKYSKVRIFFPEFNIRLYDKNSESDYFFFLHQNQNIFFSNIGNQNIFLEKTITPPSS